MKDMHRIASAGILALMCAIIAAGCSSIPKDQKTEQESAVKNQAAEYSRFGNNFYARAEYDKALEFYRLALTDNISVDNEIGMVKSYNDIGKVYAVRGNLEKAVDSFLEGYRLAQKLEDNSLLVLCETNIGEIFLRNGETNEALEMFTQALSRPIDGESTQTAILFHNTGQAYKLIGDLDRAEELITEALELNSENREYQELASNYYALASIASKRGNYEQAVDNALSALENDKRMENRIGIAKDLKALGIIYHRWGKIEEAYEYMKKAFMVYETLGILSQMTGSLKNLKNFADELGRDEEVRVYRETLESLEEE